MNLASIFKSSFILVCVVLLAGCDKEDEIVPKSELPAEIQTYISTHFPSNSISQVKVDKEISNKSYEVMLDGGIYLDFNSNNQVVDIDGYTKLPDSVIPSKILAYVAQNYPSNVITDWELDDNHQQVGLDNGIELEFNMSGNFIRIDV